ncbi:hypothetical protein [Streptomyces diastatochromogenes]|uniref:hypothetical protein n=1 Tax=Streptomyces diastatochromogenes TaxID=42236 RepID=UPI0036908060
MALSIPAAVLLGITVCVLMKGGYISVGSMLACTLFGFTLAANGGLASLAELLSSF